ncbi:uncharacterized protein J4E87_006305 [Alternaria ethzedia]|uniref:uncharacterized protein n=1 Tax=Alternaria ethzedia TaxID=181014 RepID=UPI0020C444EC|nr:uncharacterized protein J4E87_006305 [Alternaria ethzedia]KAI4622738.1 hypothetical protein J4E87_006305 [Alternaria ethzedia]
MRDWRTAAERYWPLIAERHGPLLDLVASLKKEIADALKDGKTWSGEVAKRTHCTNLQSMKSTLNREPWARRTPPSKYIPLKDKHVTFSETVLWRKFNSAAPPKELHRLASNTLLHKEEFTTSLARRVRRSTKSFKKKAIESKGWDSMFKTDWWGVGLEPWGSAKTKEEDEEEEATEEDVERLEKEFNEEIVQQLVTQPW